MLDDLLLGLAVTLAIFIDMVMCYKAAHAVMKYRKKPTHAHLVRVVEMSAIVIICTAVTVALMMARLKMETVAWQVVAMESSYGR